MFQVFCTVTLSKKVIDIWLLEETNCGVKHFLSSSSWPMKIKGLHSFETSGINNTDIQYTNSHKNEFSISTLWKPQILQMVTSLYTALFGV